ncbi:MAG: ATP-dependent sacrificial sulfur transferase LarE [Desulfuromonadales bacterium]|nr:ATP-dependent sacrificial sulfur transferase LarE [Desulfuromonadales bacterium]
MATTLDEKLAHLAAILTKMGSVLVAFSGGVDSTLLLKVAIDTLGKEKVVAFTEDSPLHQAWEMTEAKSLAGQLDVRHIIVAADELAMAEFVANPPNRCYLCKRVLYGDCQSRATELGLQQVVDGSTADDLHDYRPGRQALSELGIRSPLCEAGLGKEEIRAASRALGLPTWNKQALACLASRFPYGVEITHARLRQVEACETYLRDLGFTTFRVRYHHEVARIEVAEDDLARLVMPEIRRPLIEFFQQAGFTYVTVDLQGFRSGSMNAMLRPEEG